MKRKLTIATNIVAIVFSMGSVPAFMWGTDYANELYIQIPTTLIALLSLIALVPKQTRKEFQLHNIKKVGMWILVPVALLVSALSSTYIDRLTSLIPARLTLNIGVFIMLISAAYIYWLIAIKLHFIMAIKVLEIMLIPGAYIYRRIAGKRHLLVMGASLNIGMACLWLNLELLKDGVGVEYALGALAFAMYAGIPWIFALRLSWECAERTRQRLLMGPFMESFTMFLVAVPFVTLAILSVMAVTDGQHWITLAGIVASFLFSNAVATPFARFLRRLGGFDENHRRPIR